MKMTEEDYCIAGVHVENSKELVVFSRHLSYGKEWPSILQHNDKSYKYNGISPLPDMYVGHYFSMALYLET